MRNRQISQIKQVEDATINISPNPIKIKISNTTQIISRGSLVIRPCLKKLTSSIFTKEQATLNQNESFIKNNEEMNDLKVKVKSNFHQNSQQKSLEQSKRQSRLMNINNMSTATTINLNNSNNASRNSIIQMISRYRSLTQEDERKKGGDSPIKRNSPTYPNKKRFTQINNSSFLNNSTSVTFITAAQNQSEEIKNPLKKQLIRSQTCQSFDINRSTNRQSLMYPKEKRDQCIQIKNAFLLLPNKQFLPDDDKVLTIKTPVSSSDSSSSDLNLSLPKETQASSLLNESSKQFLKNFLKERKLEEKLINSRQKSNQVRQIQQTILNKVLNEMNKEKERSQIIKNYENVKFLQKNKKKQTSQDFDTLVHYRPKDNFCKNKNVIAKLNQGFHPPKDTSAIARDQQEEYKNFIIPCQKQNFFGSEARRMLNRGVPQILQNLQSIKY